MSCLDLRVVARPGCKLAGCTNLAKAKFDSLCADLNGVDLNGVDLNGVDLGGKDCRGASYGGARFCGVLNVATPFISFLRKGEVLAYVGLPQNLRDLKRT